MQTNRIVLFFSTVIVTSLVIDIFNILLAKKLNQNLTPDRIYKMKRAISVMMVVFGGVLIGRGFFPKKIERLQDRIENMQPENVVLGVQVHSNPAYPKI